MYQNWTLFFILLIVVVLIISVSSKDQFERYVKFKLIAPFFGLYFIVLIIMTTINANWDLCEEWDSCGSTSYDNCNDDCCEDECERKNKRGRRSQ